MSYEVQPLGAYIDIISGYAFKSKDFVLNGVPIIKIKNITPPEVNLNDLSYVSSDIANNLKKYELSRGDILIAMTGSHINQMASVVGRVAKVKYNERTMLNQRVGKVVAKENVDCCLDYVYHFLSQDSVKITLASKAGGAANQANISPSDIKALNIPSPSLPTQHRIAEILSAYDDLIENNQKQIKLLEEAAMLLYKEWFVKLRFPGHESVKIVDGVPEGWRKGKAETFFDISIGKTPPRAEPQWFTRNEDDVKWVSIADMGSEGVYIINTAERLTKTAVEKYNVKTIPADTILLSFKLTIGRVGICLEKMTTNEAIAHFRLNTDFEREYLYLMLKNYHYDSLGSTSAISKAINSKIVKAMPILVPEENLLLEFSKMAKPVVDKLRTCQQQICQARTARDKLLPKLMNGEIEV